MEGRKASILGATRLTALPMTSPTIGGVVRTALASIFNSRPAAGTTTLARNAIPSCVSRPLMTAVVVDSSLSHPRRLPFHPRRRGHPWRLPLFLPRFPRCRRCRHGSRASRLRHRPARPRRRCRHRRLRHRLQSRRLPRHLCHRRLSHRHRRCRWLRRPRRRRRRHTCPATICLPRRHPSH